MNKVALLLQSEDLPVDAMEDVLEAIQPVIALCTGATIHVIVLEEEGQVLDMSWLQSPPNQDGLYEALKRTRKTLKWIQGKDYLPEVSKRELGLVITGIDEALAKAEVK